MIAQEIHTPLVNESSGYTLKGSYTTDLIASKLWLLTKLAQIKSTVGTIYVLGSWFGNLAVINKLDPTIKYKRLINVETDQNFLHSSERIHNHLGIGNNEYMFKDANRLDYQQLGQDGVVVNTSLTDMPGDLWFDHIPAGTLVVLQARDNDPGEQYHSTNDILKRFPLTKVLYKGELDLEDPETKYTRYMVIGVK